jgi:hypothetical protein
MTNTAPPVAGKNRRKLIVAMVVAVLLVGGGTVGWFAWSAAENTRQSEAREAEAQRAADDAAAKKKAKSDAYWVKAQAEDKAVQAKETQAAAARASADRAAAAKALADAGWTEEAPAIYSADSPDNTCSYSACSKFNVMTAKDCPSGVLIRGRWLNGETVTGTVLEVTGPLYANEQAAVEANDYSDKANRIELTEFICR